MCVEGGFFFSKSISVTSRLLERWEYLTKRVGAQWLTILFIVFFYCVLSETKEIVECNEQIYSVVCKYWKMLIDYDFQAKIQIFQSFKVQILWEGL